MGYPGRRSGNDRGTDRRHASRMRKKYAVVELEKGPRPRTALGSWWHGWATNSLMRFKPRHRADPPESGALRPSGSPDPGANAPRTAAAASLPICPPGQALLCARLGSTIPISGERLVFRGPLPPIFESCWVRSCPGLIIPPNDVCAPLLGGSRFEDRPRARTDRPRRMAVSTAKPIGSSREYPSHSSSAGSFRERCTSGRRGRRHHPANNQRGGGVIEQHKSEPAAPRVFPRRRPTTRAGRGSRRARQRRAAACPRLQPASTSNRLETGCQAPAGHSKPSCRRCRRKARQQATSPARSPRPSSAKQLPGGQPQPEETSAHRKDPTLDKAMGHGIRQSTPRPAGQGQNRRRRNSIENGWISGSPTQLPQPEGAASGHGTARGQAQKQWRGGKGGGRIDADVGAFWQPPQRMVGPGQPRGGMENGGKAGPLPIAPPRAG